MTARASFSALLTMTLIAIAAGPAGAQAPPRFEVYAGGVHGGGFPLGATLATETQNQAGGGRFTLFRSESEMLAANALEARVGVRVFGGLGVEGGIAYGHPVLRTTVTQDAEDTTLRLAATDRLLQYVFDVSGVWQLTGLRFARGRAMPFVLAGGGHLRELDQERVLLTTGVVYHAGGGIKYLLLRRRSGWLKGIGVRADARYAARERGVDFEKGRRTYTTASVGGFAAF